VLIPRSWITTKRSTPKIDAPDGSGEIFWRKGKDEKDPLDWVMWFRDLKSGRESEMGHLPGFPSFDALQIGPGERRAISVEGQKPKPRPIITKQREFQVAALSARRSDEARACHSPFN
jgi:hypothetical protein